MSDATIWATIVILGIGTFLIRYSFLGLIGNRPLPDWAVRALRYVPVAVMPGLVAPLVIWPSATEGAMDPPRLIAALVALGIGATTRSVLGAIAGGMAALYLVMFAT